MFIPTGIPDTNYLPCQLIHFDNQIILYNIEGISETKQQVYNNISNANISTWGLFLSWPKAQLLCYMQSLHHFPPIFRVSNGDKRK
jgi:hypothetical protein